MNLPSLEQIETEILSRSLPDFVRAAWPIVEPGTPFVDGWHLQAICEHLEAAGRGEIRNLIINIPPRHMKSLLTSVFWFCWTWTFRPESRWLCSSYGENLAIRDSLKCRRIIESPWYRQRWGDAFQLTGDQNQKTRFENDRTGYRLATGVGGGATGEGGDIILVDDPMKALDAMSAAEQERVIDWWNTTMSTRGNNPDTVVKVVIMQRLHEQDLTGHLLERASGYEHLCLPAEYEPTERVTGIGWRDPRTEPGELLWPERFSASAVASLKAELGSYAAAGQLQQRPAPLEGGLFKRNWFEVVRAAPVNARRVRYWDKAGSQDKGDYTAGALVARDGDGVYYIEDMVRGQWTALERERIIAQTAEMDRANYGNVAIYIEQEPGSGGKESAEATIRSLAGHVVYAERVTGDKVTRAMPFSAQCEGRNVRLVAGLWVPAFLDEVTVFPNGANDDQVDSSAGGFNKLAIPVFASPLAQAAAKVRV